MGLGRKIEDGVHLPNEVAHQGGVTNIAVNEVITRIRFQPGEVVQIPGVSEEIQVDHLDVLVLLEEVPHQIGPDESGATGHEQFQRSITSSVPPQTSSCGDAPTSGIRSTGAFSAAATNCVA